MKAIGSFQERYNFIEPINALLASDKVSFHRHYHGYEAEAGATAGHQIAGAISLPCHAAVGLGIIVKEFKGLLLDEGEEGVIGEDGEFGGGVQGGVEVFGEGCELLIICALDIP